MMRWGVLLGLGLLVLGGIGLGMAQGDGEVFVPMVVGGPDAPAGCSICSYDAYNCSDFDTQAAAQACFDFCMEQVGYDVHQLDADDNGLACEALPRVATIGGWVLEP